ncbi:BTAD domain-containing putative transcriptional regulator [Catenulispora subtropica]|uniref:OmpR/PhoB-type domain-containing protein n=1 Tax=Catenulispora subtropica TaxID=450798 RepID=A0ABP5C649_9ACTN
MNTTPDGDGSVQAVPVRIQMLGRFATRHGDVELPAREFGGRLAARLLRMLALRRGTLLSKDVIVEALWPKQPPADAPGNVEVLVSRIRRALGDRALVATGPGGYSLVGDRRCSVDVEDFLSAAASAHASAGRDPGRALAVFRRALALWGGEPLAEDAYEDWAQEHRRHLWRVHLEVLEGAATAALETGDPVVALEWAQQACEQEPLREAAALLTVRALAAAGDRAGALSRFDGFAARLSDELGVEPSAEALQLRRRVLCDQIRPRPARRDTAVALGTVGYSDSHFEVAARIAGLPDRQRETLALLALLARHTTANVLASAADAGQREILDALDVLCRSGLALREHKTYVITPGPVARVVTRAIDPVRRARLHLLLADALVANAGDPAEVAAHLAAGGDRQAAARAFAEASERQLDRLADHEALRLAHQGLTVCERGETRVSLLKIRGEAHRRLGELDAARTDLQGALTQVARGTERSRILARLGILEARSRDAARGDELISLAIAEAGRDPAALGQSLAAGAIVDLTLERQNRSRRRFKQASLLLEQAADPDGAARLLYWRGMAQLIAGRLPEAITELGDLAGLPVTPEELLRWWDPQAARGHALVFAARPADGLTEIDQALSRARAVGHPVLRCGCLWHRSEALSALDRPDEASENAQAAVEIAERIGHAEWSAAALRGLGIARQTAGDLAGAESAFERSRSAAPDNALFATWASARLGLIRIGQGRLAEADEMTASALEHGAPLARHEARWARVELAHARGEAGAPGMAEDALTAARASGYLALVPRLAELATA